MVDSLGIVSECHDSRVGKLVGEDVLDPAGFGPLVRPCVEDQAAQSVNSYNTAQQRVVFSLESPIIADGMARGFLRARSYRRNWWTYSSQSFPCSE